MNHNAINDGTHEEESANADWVAFQYLCGELTEDESSRFESRLQDDQLAREALARAVELTQAVNLIEADADRVAVREATTAVVHRAGGDWLTPAAWLMAAALACVAVMLAGNFVGRSSSPGFPESNPVAQPLAVNGASARDSGELASFWVNTAEVLVTTDLLGNVDFSDELFDDEVFDTPGATVAEVDVDRLQAPSWMMAALAASEATEMQE